MGWPSSSTGGGLELELRAEGAVGGLEGPKPLDARHFTNFALLRVVGQGWGREDRAAGRRDALS